jgi:uncharacterized membrane protein YcaP (DUF421 family)
MPEHAFFGGWSSLVRVIVAAPLLYLALVVVLRVSGKRVLAKMNAFDLVVTVSLGSALATGILSSSVAIVEALAGFGMLVLLQYVTAFAAVHVPAAERLIKSEPRLLARNGQLLRSAMAAERVTEREVLQAVRAQGLGSLADVAAVVLETDGSFSVLQNSADIAPPARN